MKKYRWVVSLFMGLTGILLFLSSCKKINEATELGGDLIPPVDNVNTFETSFLVETDNLLFNDTTKIQANDIVALGHISNDPEFGETHADAYFTISPSSEGVFPFVERDSLLIDSAVLSLRFRGSFGDTNSLQTVRVFEIDQNSGFVDSVVYKYNNGNEFATTGPELGSKTFSLRSLRDSMTLISGSDTQRVANVLRIRLDTLLGRRFSNYDTTNGSNGGFKNDSLFNTLFKGLAVKADASGNGLGYFDVFDQTNTKLTVYFRTTINGVKDTSSTDFVHFPRTNAAQGGAHPGGVANPVKRTPGGGWATYINNGLEQDDKIYLQSAPGSYANIRIPALDTFSNNVIHLAELIIYKLPSAADDVFAPPSQLMLDKINNNRDTVFNLENDLPIVTGSPIPFSSFGGQLKSDNTYRFKISRHIQAIVTKKEPNNILRLSAPLNADVYVKNLSQKVTFQVLDRIADGRVVLGGGNFADPSLRMRLRIIYSKL